MSWRTLITLWVVTVIVNTTGGGMWDFNAIEIGFAIAAILATLFKVYRWAERKLRQRKTFDLRFPDDFPITPGIERPIVKHIPLEQEHIQHVLIEVVVNTPLELKRFDFRFVATKNGCNLNQPLPIEIDSGKPIAEKFLHASSLLSAIHNPGYGINVSFGARSLRRGESIYFELAVKTHRLWTGYLSFRGYDDDGNPRFSRRVFSIVPLTKDS